MLDGTAPQGAPTELVIFWFYAIYHKQHTIHYYHPITVGRRYCGVDIIFTPAEQTSPREVFLCPKYMNKEHDHHYEHKKQPELEFEAIVFDVDSTLVDIEGLDWLARHKGCADSVVALTKRSMDGQMDFGEAMKQKMAILAPSQAELEKLGAAYCDHVVAGAREVINEIHHQGKEVWILTGNFDVAVHILAHHLGIPRDRVICNHVYFDEQGAYAGFDQRHPLAKNGGKAIEIQKVLDEKGKRIAFIGDGITDLDVQPYVDLFVGFGGVVTRDIIKKKADAYISTPNLLELLPILQRKERRTIASYLQGSHHNLLPCFHI